MAKIYLEGKLPPVIQKGLAFDIGSGPVPGEMHLSAGQESVAVGVCAHLKKEDMVVGTHRPHHFAIAKGVPLLVGPPPWALLCDVMGMWKGYVLVLSRRTASCAQLLGKAPSTPALALSLLHALWQRLGL